jgi:pyridoxal phosphate enzyme (YggS family)
MSVIDNLNEIRKSINSSSSNANIIVVSKNFSLNSIQPLIDVGHIHFGENRVQEAIEKWSSILLTKVNLQLHLVGKLQTNKVKDALKIFSFIHSLDREKLAIDLKKEEDRSGKTIKYFIQINFDKQLHKSGIDITEADDFIDYCRNQLNLNIIGLMCLPPLEFNPDLYFKQLANLAKKKSLNQLSMGMSADYQVAVRAGATYVRVGSAIFGERV